MRVIESINAQLSNDEIINQLKYTLEHTNNPLAKKLIQMVLDKQIKKA